MRVCLRTWSTAHRRRRLLPGVTALVALGTLGSLAATEPAAVSVDSAAVATAAPQQVAAAQAARVRLDQRTGTVVGDGQTRYVANRTEFRPRATETAVPPRVRARSWVVVDLDSGHLLGKHRARRPLPQASTIKLLTAVTATQVIGADTRHRVSRFEAGQTCSCAGLRPRLRYHRDTLLAGMLLKSGNDAAEAVAGSHPKGRHAFYDEMNRVAAELGATDTVARNASGLTASGSHSSSRDLVLLLRAALADPTVSAILAMPSAEIASVRGRDRHTVWRSTDYVNRYPGSLGKSGWTTPAQNTLVVVTELAGRRIAVASMGAPSGYSTKGARALTEWAAANFEALAPVGRLPLS